MKQSVPWNVPGVRPEAVETAREAARRSGMSLGDWLNDVIDTAVDPGPPPNGSGSSVPNDDFGADEPALDPMESVNQRLARLTRQLDRLTKQTIEVPSPRPLGGQDPSALRLTDAIARLDSRLDEVITEGRRASNEIERRVSLVDRTLADLREPKAPPPERDWAAAFDEVLEEISARQRELDGEPPKPRARPAPAAEARAPAPAAPAPAPSGAASLAAPSLSRLPEPPRYDAAPRATIEDFSGLQRQLDQLTSKMESLRNPCRVDEAVAALRADLAEIAHMLTEAMPRQAIEALESEVRKLAERLVETRRSAEDTAALASIERGLGEVRDALRALTPAENLVGVNQAVQTLTQKIDLIASSTQDPAALQQFEAAISGLRGIVSHAASNEALARLGEDVRSLSGKVDRIAAEAAGNSVFAALEQRIAALADAFEARGPAEPPEAPALEAMVKGLTDKIEHIQLSRGDHMALGHLEDRIVKLVEKLDASDARFGHLEVIERGLADLLIQLEQLRATNASTEASPVVDTLRRDVQSLRDNERQTQDSLEMMHGTLGHVVDRLAMLESDIRDGAASATDPAPAARPAQAAQGRAAAPPSARMSASVAMSGGPPGAAAANARPAPAAAGERRPIDPSLPPDHPLEPGAARGRGGPSAADRIAASEAALGPAKPTVVPDPGPKSNFIAAARRAAQSAAAAARGANPEPTKAAPAGTPQLAQKLGKHVKTLLLGGSIILILFGAWQLASSFLDSGNQANPPAAGAAPSAPAGAGATMPAPGKQSGLGSDDVTGSLGATPIPSSTAFGPPTVPVAPAPPHAAAAPAAPASSAAAPAAVAAPAPAAANAAPPLTPDKLPPVIGGPLLRKAAAEGNSAAEFEIASRFAEGRKVVQNLEEAVRWYERAASHGLAAAQYRLGSLYEKGQGVRRDTALARKFYTQAAEKGYPKAMHNLAVLYAEGIDGKPDFKQAGHWFRKAANYGVADSEYNLGILYARGIGLEQNLAESYKWFALAAQQGDTESAKKRDDVAARLDPQSLMAAKLAAQTFIPDPQNEDAVSVKTPPGGWDQASVETKSASAAARSRRPIKLAQ